MDLTTGLLSLQVEDGDTVGAVVLQLQLQDVGAGIGTDGTIAGAEAEAEAAGRDYGRSATRAGTTEGGRGPAGTAAPATLGRQRPATGRSLAEAWPLLLLGWQCAAGPVDTDLRYHYCLQRRRKDTAQPAESAQLLLQAAAPAAAALSASVPRGRGTRTARRRCWYRLPRPRRFRVVAAAYWKKKKIPARAMKRAEGGGRSGANRPDLGTAAAGNCTRNCRQFDL